MPVFWCIVGSIFQLRSPPPSGSARVSFLHLPGLSMWPKALRGGGTVLGKPVPAGLWVPHCTSPSRRPGLTRTPHVFTDHIPEERLISPSPVLWNRSSTHPLFSKGLMNLLGILLWNLCWSVSLSSPGFTLLVNPLVLHIHPSRAQT